MGPTFFLGYINGLPDGVHSLVKLFADDDKVFAVVNTVNDANLVQGDLHNVDNWSDKWQIKFNYLKCNHMPLGKDQPVVTYYMNNNGEPTEIKKTTEQKDLGVLIDKKLKCVPQIQAIVKKTNRNLGISFKRSFSYIDKPIVLNLYKALVRPHLEYASTVWTVIYNKDCIAIENVQRRATRLVQGVRNLNYTERMTELGLPSIQYRRTHG